MREDQIQRYGRQILLKQVGGRGQQKLLERAIDVDLAVDAPGAAEAIAYLAAGGSPLRVRGAPGGFLADTSPAALNPDAVAPADAVPFLTVAAHPVAGCVVVVTDSVAYATADTCRACLAANLGAGSPPEGDDVTWGSLIALVAQRLCLDQSEPLGVVRLVDGVPHADDPARCPAHR